MHQKVQPWHLILVGIGLTIAAALLQHVFVEEKFSELADIRTKITSLDNRIDGLWQQNIEAERKKEFTALLMHKVEHTSEPPKFIVDYLRTISDGEKLGISNVGQLDQVLTLISEHQLTLREKIDDLYFDHISLSQKVGPIQKQISQNKNIALLMQLLGLILVLSKDLARRER